MVGPCLKVLEIGLGHGSIEKCRAAGLLSLLIAQYIPLRPGFVEAGTISYEGLYGLPKKLTPAFFTP